MNGIYTVLKEDLMLGDVNLGNGGDTIKVALYDDSHAFTAADTVYTTDNEISGTGYTAGGATLAGQAVTAGTTTKFDGTDTAWTTATFTAYHAVLYDASNTNSLICSFDFGAGKEVTNGTFTIVWSADGILTLASV